MTKKKKITYLYIIWKYYNCLLVSVCVCNAALTPSHHLKINSSLEISVWKIDWLLLTKSHWTIVIFCLAPSSCCTIVVFLMWRRLVRWIACTLLRIITWWWWWCIRMRNNTIRWRWRPEVTQHTNKVNKINEMI